MCGMTLGSSATVSSSLSVIQLGCEVRKRMRSRPSISWIMRSSAGRSGPSGNILAVAIDDLTEQGDFLYALGDERACFADRSRQRAAALDAAAVRDDAEGAGMRAAQHHRDMSGNQLAAFVQRQQQITIHRRQNACRQSLLPAAGFRPGSDKRPADPGLRAEKKHPRMGSVLSGGRGFLRQPGSPSG